MLLGYLQVQSQPWHEPMHSACAAHLLQFLCTHRLITCSINLVLLKKACFAVHTTIGVHFFFPGFDLPQTAGYIEEGVQMQVVALAGPVYFSGESSGSAVRWMNHLRKGNPDLTIRTPGM